MTPTMRREVANICGLEASQKRWNDHALTVKLDLFRIFCPKDRTECSSSTPFGALNVPRSTHQRGKPRGQLFSRDHPIERVWTTIS